MRISQARLTAGLDRFPRIDLATHQQIFGPIQRMTARQLIELAEQVGMIEADALLPTGVIVGSALVKTLFEEDSDRGLKALGELARELKAGVTGARA